MWLSPKCTYPEGVQSQASRYSDGVLAGRPGLFSRQGKRCFSYPQRPYWLWGPTQRVLGALSQGVKGPGREANHSPPSSAEVNYGEAIPPLPMSLHGIVLN
jgi:hypothetical protein